MDRFVIIIILLSVIIKIIIDIIVNIKYRNILKSTKINELRKLIEEKKFYNKTISNNKCFIIISEYGIYEGIYIDYCGTLSGNESDIKLTLKSNRKTKQITNPLSLFKKFKDKYNNKIKSYNIKQYVILGSDCIFRIDVKGCETIRLNEFKNIIKQAKNKKYTQEEVDEIYSSIKKDM